MPKGGGGRRSSGVYGSQLQSRHNFCDEINVGLVVLSSVLQKLASNI